MDYLRRKKMLRKPAGRARAEGLEQTPGQNRGPDSERHPTERLHGHAPDHRYDCASSFCGTGGELAEAVFSLAAFLLALVAFRCSLAFSFGQEMLA